MFARVSNVFASFGGAVRRFPMVALAALVAAACAVVANHGPEEGAVIENCWRVVQLMLVGFPLFVGVAYFGEFFPRFRKIAWAGSLLLLMAIWFRMPPERGPFVLIYAWLATTVSVLAFASTVPGLGGTAAWWRVNVGTAQALILAFVASAIVEGGLQTAVFSIHALFGFGMDKFHIDALTIVALLFAPMAVLALLPPAREEGSIFIESFWRNLGQWVLAPLGFVFIAILGAYAGLILIKRELPAGMVATPVLALGVYGTAAMLLLQPWRDVSVPARWFARIYPIAFIVSSILLFIALAERISAYGMTFDRYTALAAGIWLVFAALLFLFRITNSGMLIMAAAALGALAGSMGPISAGALSLRGQTARIGRMLKTSGHDDAQIFDGLKFLSENFGQAAVEKISGPLGDVKSESSSDIAKAAAEKLGVTIGTQRADQFAYRWSSGALPIDDFTSILSGEKSSLGKTKTGEEIDLRNPDGRLCVYVGNKEVRELLPGESGTLPESTKLLTVPFFVDGREFLLVVLRANGMQSKGKATSFSFVEYVILAK